MTSKTLVRAMNNPARDAERFLKFSYRIYPEDSLWVAPLLMDLCKVFTPANPLFQHARMQLWLAERDGREVGRVAGVIDSAHERITGEKAAFFGFFECIDDATVAADLFHTAEAWAREQGMTKIIGPMNPTTNDECGLLVEGFDLLPSFMMPYNPAYYQRLVEGNGYVKAKDLLAYGIDMATIPMDRLTKIGKKVRQRIQGLEIRPVKRKSLGADLEKIKEIYNEAWEDNWGFVPMTDAEVDFMADRLKPLLMEGLVWVAEVDRAPVGFLLAMPDFNPVLKPLRGRLLTPRILGFLPYAMGWKKTQGSRVLTLGVKKSYRGRGLETAMLIEGLHTGYQAGFTVSEASWILEDNVMMRRMLEAIDGKVTKRYRLYEKAL